MCGIAGAVGIKVQQENINELLSTMRNRGPDAQGYMTDEECCLLHSRLTVIDPEGGSQPMMLSWAGEKYIIVYNGELYNTQEVRTLLIKLGHHFKGYSDTEVVLHAYAQWEEGCLGKLNGIFAFGVWEAKRKKLFLARDRMGVKPLFYKLCPSGIVFASEIKTILKFPDVKPVLDSYGVMQVIMLGPGRIPGSGVLKDIKEIEPGCFGYFHCSRWSLNRYWKLRDREHTESFAETAEHVRTIVVDAICRQMVSDVPIGTFLSGGLDSSLISSVIAKELEKKGERLRTFSVDYENNEKYFVAGKFQPNADSEYIGIMSDYLDSIHHKTVLSADDLVAALDDATIARDLPGMADVDFFSSCILWTDPKRGKGCAIR